MLFVSFIEIEQIIEPEVVKVAKVAKVLAFIWARK